jgi:hypothetical protein
MLDETGRRVCATAVAFLLTIAGTAAPKYSGGTGEPNDPYQLATAADLIALGETPEDYGRCFVLTADIDLDPNLPGRKVFSRAVIPNEKDPTSLYQADSFSGTFDGQGHRIANMTISGTHRLGLFGRVDDGAAISRVGLESVRVTGTEYDVGALVGSNGGHVSDCYSTGIVASRGESVGGLIGQNSGPITRCHTAGVVNGSWRAGGLAGQTSYGAITDSCSTATVNGINAVGGLVGLSFSDSLSNSYSTGTVTGDIIVGGLVGYQVYSVIADCYSTGSVSGRSSVGGLVGFAEVNGFEGRGVFNSYSTSSVSGVVMVGGLMGENAWAPVCNSYSAGPVNGKEQVGGLVGYEWPGKHGDDVTVHNSFWDTGTSGQVVSAGGTPRTTAQMQDPNTFLDAGWDFLGETNNGLLEIWRMPSEVGYPLLAVPPEPNGRGTPEDPYLLATALDFRAVRYRPAASYRLVSDIDLSGTTWSAAVIPTFSGSLDGQHHRITNLTISGGYFLGLFDHLAPGAVVCDLGLENINVSGRGSDIGGLAVQSWGTVLNCYASGAVTGGVYVGGLIARNSGSLRCSYSRVAVSGVFTVGGLVGTVSRYGSVEDCYAQSRATATSSAGGLVGGIDGVVLHGHRDLGQIRRCYATGEVKGLFSGGLVGSAEFGEVSSSFWDASTFGQMTDVPGTAKTRSEMQTAATFLDAGWDFVGETANGTEDIWWIEEGEDYPRLWWEDASR